MDSFIKAIYYISFTTQQTTKQTHKANTQSKHTKQTHKATTKQPTKQTHKANT